jgi:hypothetical protein
MILLLVHHDRLLLGHVRHVVQIELQININGAVDQDNTTLYHNTGLHGNDLADKIGRSHLS